MTTFPLKVGPTGRYLVDQNGVPFPLLIDSGWETVTTLSTTDTSTYLADRIARGFNTFPVELIDPEFNWGNTVNGGTWGGNVNGDFPFTSIQGGGTYNNSQTQHAPDFSTTKTAYWTHADAVLNQYPSSVIILLYPFWLGSHTAANPGAGGLINGYYDALASSSSGVRQGYGQFLANRYGLGGTNPLRNMIWVPGGDNDTLAEVSTPAALTDVVTGIKSVDSTILFSADCLGVGPLQGWPPATYNFWQVNNIYTDNLVGNNPQIYQQCKSYYQSAASGTPYPQYFKEGVYEGEGSSTPQQVRSQSWQAFLGGCFGYAFGNHQIWQFSSGWQSQLGSVGSIGAQALNTFWSSRTWYKLAPDYTNTFLTNGASYTGANFAAAALASDGSWGAIYVPVTESLTVALGGFRSRVMASWYDPTNGLYVGIGSYANSGSQSFTPPSANSNGDADWVLLLDTQTTYASRFLQSMGR